MGPKSVEKSLFINLREARRTFSVENMRLTWWVTDDRDLNFSLCTNQVLLPPKAMMQGLCFVRPLDIIF